MYMPPLEEDKAPKIVPIIANKITPQFAHPKKGNKQIVAKISVMTPQIFEITLSIFIWFND